MYDPAPMQVVCAMIVRDDGKVLVCRRGEGRKLAGLWEFPGGKIEAGERAEDALVREIREELGVEISVGEARPVVDWDYGGMQLRLLPFLCRIVRGEPQALEHAELRWCGGAECSALDWAPADVPVWRAYLLDEGRAVADFARHPG
jgi:8-oxo-dGTP diphosphatase